MNVESKKLIADIPKDGNWYAIDGNWYAIEGMSVSDNHNHFFRWANGKWQWMLLRGQTENFEVVDTGTVDDLPRRIYDR